MSDDNARDPMDVPEPIVIKNVRVEETTLGKTPPEVTYDNPQIVGFVFLQALGSDEYDGALRNLVTPESRDQWGDFSEAKKFYRSIPDPGFGSLANRAHAASDVAYVKVLPNFGEQLGVEDAALVSGNEVLVRAHVLTLVWRPEYGSWLVHAFGGYVSPDDLERTSPDVAPSPDLH